MQTYQTWDELDENSLGSTVNYVIPHLKDCIKVKGGHYEQVV